MPFPTLYTERLKIRSLKESDAEPISVLRSNDIINRYLTRASSCTLEDALEFIAKRNSPEHTENSRYWAITFKDSDELIGTICLFSFNTELSEVEIGYELSTDQHGRGIMNEAIQAVIQYAHQELKFKTILAFTHHENLASRKLLSKTGFVLDEDRKEEGLESFVVYVRKK